MVQVLALFYVAVLVPLRTGFGIELDPGTTGWWIELVVDVYFILDLFLNFVTSFYDNDAVLVRAPRGLHEDAVGEVQVGGRHEHRKQALGDRAALLVSG